MAVIWVIYLAVLLTGAWFAILLLFPTNLAFQTNRNPVILSQFGNQVDPNSKLLRLKLMPYTGYHMPPNVREKGTFSGHGYDFRTNNCGFLTAEDFFPFAEPPKPKAADDRVVLLTGGSPHTAWAPLATSPRSPINSRRSSTVMIPRTIGRSITWPWGHGLPTRSSSGWTFTARTFNPTGS